MPPKILCVAEKPSVAKEISRILSGGRLNTEDVSPSDQSIFQRRGHNKYQTVLDFECQIPRLGGLCHVVFTSVLGHMKETEVVQEYKSWNSCAPRVLFGCPVSKTTKRDMLDVEKTLKQEARGAEALILWTDCDREGENIGFEVAETCTSVKRSLRVLRARFSALIPRDIHNALAHLAPPNQHESDAADARAEIDLRIGAAFTRFQTLNWQRKFEGIDGKTLISFGPCQFPTLGFIVERWEQIESFVSEPFWYIKLSLLKDGEQHSVEFNWKQQRVFDRKICIILYQFCMENPTATITSIRRTPDTKRKPYPMSTVTFQKLATKKLRMASQQAMQIAEKLYHSGYVSYPRTETEVFKQGTDLLGIIRLQTNHLQWGAFAQSLTDGGGFEWPRAGQHDDQAHPPIHPTRPAPDLQGQEKAVYELITRHFLACCSKDARGSKTVIEARVANQEFSCNGLQILERNYLEVYPYDVWSDRALPAFTEGEVLQPHELVMQEGHTTAPPPLTETELIKLMDKHGIGTDATIAQHITTIQDRGYAIKQGQAFRPTDLGVALLHGYKHIGFDMGDSALRRQMEQDFKNICTGQKTRAEVVEYYVQKFLEIFDQSNARIPEIEQKIGERFRLAGADSYQEEISDFSQCGGCGGQLALRTTSTGDKVLFCAACDLILQTPRGEVSPHEHRCPLCNFQVLAVQSQHGRTYTVCPKCYNQPPAPAAGVQPSHAQKLVCFACTADCPLARGSAAVNIRSCPACGNGMRVRLRKENGAAFLSCSGFPHCKLALSLPPAKSVTPAPTDCEQCGAGVRPLVFEFESGRVPPGLMQQHTGCVGGCDSFMNDLLRQSNSRDIEEFFGGAASVAKPAPPSYDNGLFANGAGVRKPPPPSYSSTFHAKQPAYAKPAFGKPAAPEIKPAAKPSPYAKPAAFAKPAAYAKPAAFSTPSSAYAKPPADSPVVEGDVPLCECGNPCRSLVTKKEGPNQHRPFFACAKNKDEPGRCNFFKWADERPSSSSIFSAGGSSSYGRGRGATNTWSSSSASSSSSSGYGRGGSGGSSAMSNATCFGCGQVGHFKTSCPNAGQTSSYGGSSYGSGRGAGRGRGFNSNKRSAGRGQYPAKRAATGKTSGGRKCGACHQPGHTKKNCPNNGGGGYNANDYGDGGDDGGGDGGGGDWDDGGGDDF